MSEQLAAPALTRAHTKRLRVYFRCGANGGASRADNVDLDLVACGYIARSERSLGYPQFAITPAGELALAAEKGLEIERRQPHHDLGGRLAEWLRGQQRITWENIQLTVPRLEGGQRVVRPDVFSMRTTYNAKRINPCVHEIKVSRADYLADLAKPEKRSGYAAVCEQFFYVAPAGVIGPDELPDAAGLLVEGKPGEFDVVVRPRCRPVELEVHLFMNLILKPGSLNPL